MFTLSEIATILHGSVVGDEQHFIKRPAKIEDAQADEITFLANEKYIPYLKTTQAGCVVISTNLYDSPYIFEGWKSDKNFILVEDAYVAFTQLLHLAEQNTKHEVHSANYKIGKDTVIYEHVFIGNNVQIGDNCIIYPNVSIYKDCVIGNNCIIHSGAVIGSDGFGFVQQQNGEYHKIPQLGNVIIEDNCEIGANTCIDRATMGSTIIRRGVKLDNLIQVAHNVEIGEHTVIASQTGISGSTKIGHHNRIGGQVGFVGHISIAPYTQINAKSAVAGNITKENQALSGIPVMDIKLHFKAIAAYKQLPELLQRVRNLEAEISEIKKKDS
ncbi:MAG TPA: UDP-3-O-(3-hydroxymyristoyl)glucosamine N-acyltransferase [Chitinophagales bacterium]|nr:UDP-3-O-(3-hydroxymyristoyl)glucosamine N-acyltransferase [Chitinophagales bacterium]HNL84917.1 UDP-3-O-(3-hydroxymyristoyl)glucosamine N-acyltransferase [Chitinophagales bacterium]